MPSPHSATSKKVIAKKAIGKPAATTSGKKISVARPAVAAKSVAARPVANKQAENKHASPKKGIGNGDRQQMVSVAAYYRAERRGFNGGSPLEDWLAAEQEVDALFH